MVWVENNCGIEEDTMLIGVQNVNTITHYRAGDGEKFESPIKCKNYAIDKIGAELESLFHKCNPSLNYIDRNKLLLRLTEDDNLLTLKSIFDKWV